VSILILYNAILMWWGRQLDRCKITYEDKKKAQQNWF